MGTGNLLQELEDEKKPKPRSHIVYLCEWCDKTTAFKVISQHHRYSYAEPPEETTFAACEECQSSALFVREDFGEGFDEDSFYRIHPPHERHLGFYLPDIVRSSYEEAARCETSKAWLGCAVMVGRTLEAVCKEFDPAIKSIYQGLKDLHAKGTLSQDMLDWATELRLIRNIGAHATADKVSAIDAHESVDFLQAMLEIMYDLRPKFQKLKERRGGKA